jgi:hypothetical protein
VRQSAEGQERHAGSVERIFRPLFIGVVAVQGVHVFEHIVQLIQVFVLGIPDNKALGLLGYIFQFQGTEEWLHLVFNVTYLLALLLLVVPLRSQVPGVVPRGRTPRSSSVSAWRAGTTSSTR